MYMYIYIVYTHVCACLCNFIHHEFLKKMTFESVVSEFPLDSFKNIDNFANIRSQMIHLNHKPCTCIINHHKICSLHYDEFPVK